jgi:hypothetical protein
MLFEPWERRIFRRAFCPYGQKRKKQAGKINQIGGFFGRVLFANSRGNTKGGTNEAY